MHGLFEVDGIENLNAIRLIDHFAVFVLYGLIDRIAVPVLYWLMVLAQLGTHFRCTALEHFTALHQDSAFRERSVKIENGKVTNNFQFRNLLFLHHHASVASSYPPECPCSSC